MCWLGGLAMLNCALVSGGLARVNAWGYGDRGWVGLWSAQTRRAKWPPSALYGLYDINENPYSEDLGPIKP